MQLTKVSDQFEAMGINVAPLTFDSVEVLKEAQEDEGISFFLLHDEDVTHVNAFGVRNLEYSPENSVYWDSISRHLSNRPQWRDQS